jgi:hypothetical protein
VDLTKTEPVDLTIRSSRHPTRELCVETKKGDAVMRLVPCILLLALSPSFAFAAKGTMSLSQAQAAAARGDAEAAAAIATNTDRETCFNECSKRGHDKRQCTNACRPGLCHPGAEQPYCVR